LAALRRVVWNVDVGSIVTNYEVPAVNQEKKV
jgi:hypothetical protein